MNKFRGKTAEELAIQYMREADGNHYVALDTLSADAKWYPCDFKLVENIASLILDMAMIAHLNGTCPWKDKAAQEGDR